MPPLFWKATSRPSSRRQASVIRLPSASLPVISKEAWVRTRVRDESRLKPSIIFLDFADPPSFSLEVDQTRLSSPPPGRRAAGDSTRPRYRLSLPAWAIRTPLTISAGSTRVWEWPPMITSSSGIRSASFRSWS